MPLSKLKLTLLIGVPLLLIVAALTGYIIYTAVSAQQAENREKVENFGELIIPLDSTLSQSATNLNPTINQEGLSPTQRIIMTLKDERSKLIEEAVSMREEISSLQAQVADLNRYKLTNERYAPHTFNEEVSTVHTRMKQILASQEESKRFTYTQLKGMAAAAAQEYRRYLTMHKLLLDKNDIDTVVNNHLPVYAYCIGDGMDIAANNRIEEQQVVEYFKTSRTDLMSARLKSDLKAILKPCQALLAERLAYLSP
ncbi:hypothetical protein Q4488_00275 [Amphritea sp. 1_MG-2023]|uniref:hypothetical protein n=1 Tax=Amphritea sp. 1_MG-2023 TaxID=3062670 RepID=UPI0026E18E0D|nr:hypothetical protein [Amphritea sp. 1_MG-2023]MDO6561808.1 hypothetical protein [Amphritea sp. 1_MG-2023]